MIKDNEVITQAQIDFDVVKKRCDERFKFIKKQVADIEEERKSAAVEFWNKSEAEMVAKGIIPKTEDNEYGPFTLQDGVIYSGRKRDGMRDFLKGAFGIEI